MVEVRIQYHPVHREMSYQGMYRDRMVANRLRPTDSNFRYPGCKWAVHFEKLPHQQQARLE